MGSRGLSSKNSNKKGGGRNPKDIGVNINLNSFKTRRISQRTIDIGMSYLYAIYDYMGMPKGMLPEINMRAYLKNNSIVIGACELDAMDENMNVIKLNASYFTGDNVYNGIPLHGDTFAHEYIHALESFIIKTNLTSMMDRINAWDGCEYAKVIIDKAITKLGGKPSDWEKYAGEVSSYAKQDHSECLAECGKEFSHGGPQSDFVKEVMRQLRLEVRRCRAKRR